MNIFNKKPVWAKIEEKSSGAWSWTEYTDHNGRISIIYNLMAEPGFENTHLNEYKYYVRRLNDIYDVCYSYEELKVTAEDLDEYTHDEYTTLMMDDGNGYYSKSSTLRTNIQDVFKTKQPFMKILNRNNE